MHHFIISTKKDCVYHHVTLDEQGEVFHKHSRNIFTKAGNYTKAYKDFLTKIGLTVETVHQNISSVGSLGNAKEYLCLSQRLAEIEKWINNPEDAPAEIMERISALNL